MVSRCRDLIALLRNELIGYIEVGVVRRACAVADETTQQEDDMKRS